ncbi:MAG TPA: tripartite tricarboxylate transporter TctB family protein [Candidatus Limnocylindria bacterium]|nr:tripartite tricarboxylate transporter TctB family protein [Candidatus Limnocylindria bacterium]
MRPYQVATAAAFMLVAAVAMIDSRAGALVDRTGTQPGGIGAGFYPFWSAALVLACAAYVGYRSWVTPQPGTAAFENREALIAALKLIVPMIVATASIVWLGLYVVTALYMGLFARWIGHYRWISVLAIVVLMPAAVYATFELGFRVSLPKSFLYDVGVLPF